VNVVNPTAQANTVKARKKAEILIVSEYRQHDRFG